MMNKNNATFEEMKRIGREWEEKRAAHQAKKQEIIDTYGWDSEELKAWYAEKEAMKFPFPTGAQKAYRAWAQSIARQEDEVEMEDSCWENEWHDFIETLRNAGVETFVTTCKSTGLMEDLHGYAKEGCTMLGLCTITRRESRWGDEEPYEVQGIRFRIN